ncbi:unnamed protein product [Phytophthora fragariaefolia]|uniref:Unnamed protein product n=1 Tax=Phytophthora fragariaefolia TaxID=1490495 RepID=A0A9W6XX62_9STRA|nr:unnamed protein product [Phytophthora fragariaefolia]
MQFSLTQAKLLLHGERDRCLESTWVLSEEIGFHRPTSKALHERDDLCRLVYRIKLDENDDDFKDRVLETGCIAESNVLAYLQDRGIKAKGARTVLRETRKLLRAGDLDERIIIFRQLLAIDRIENPAPADNIFTVADQLYLGKANDQVYSEIKIKQIGNNH